MSGCLKKRYPSQVAALLALRAIQKRSPEAERKRPTGVYLCSQCRGQWHLTSKSASQSPPWQKACPPSSGVP
ncbi:hypothetical protein GCM10027261_03760 [Geodermatophilus arenarius]